MKIEKISYNKIKVTVSADDMQRWGVSFESFISDTPETRELFRTLIKRAEFETGFCIDDSRVMVEAVPHKYDGLIVFVTKLEGAIEFAAPTRAKLRAKPIAQKHKNSGVIFEFEDIDAVCEYIAAGSEIYADGDLYAYGDRYYLIISAVSRIGFHIAEYAKRVDIQGISEAFLAEHGKMIAKGNALETIEKYFNLGG